MTIVPASDLRWLLSGALHRSGSWADLWNVYYPINCGSLLMSPAGGIIIILLHNYVTFFSSSHPLPLIFFCRIFHAIITLCVCLIFIICKWKTPNSNNSSWSCWAAAAVDAIIISHHRPLWLIHHIPVVNLLLCLGVGMKLKNVHL